MSMCRRKDYSTFISFYCGGQQTITQSGESSKLQQRWTFKTDKQSTSEPASDHNNVFKNRPRKINLLFAPQFREFLILSSCARWKVLVHPFGLSLAVWQLRGSSQFTVKVWGSASTCCCYYSVLFSASCTVICLMTSGTSSSTSSCSCSLWQCEHP